MSDQKKQIEEMAKDLEDACENKGCNVIRDCDKCRAEWLYEQARNLWDMIDCQKNIGRTESTPTEPIQTTSVNEDSKKEAEKKALMENA